jgi:hypothetical protein
MTSDDRRDVQKLAPIPQVSLLKQFFNKVAIKDIQLLCGLRTCRIHRGSQRSADVLRWSEQFARDIDPLILTALVERIVARGIGGWAAVAFAFLIMVTLNTSRLLTAPLAARLFADHRKPEPQSGSMAA